MAELQIHYCPAFMATEKKKKKKEKKKKGNKTEDRNKNLGSIDSII